MMSCGDEIDVDVDVDEEMVLRHHYDHGLGDQAWLVGLYSQLPWRGWL